MPVVYSSSMRRRYHAPLLSGATALVVLGWISLIIFAFLISFFTGQMWVKENSYREQPEVSFVRSSAIKLQGMRGGEPFEAIYSTVPSINELAGSDMRMPIISTSVEDNNIDNIADVVHINATFPLAEDEHVMGVQGIYAFSYKLSNFVRLDMEAPIAVVYSSGVPGRALHVDGRMALKLANPLPFIPAVRGGQDAPVLNSSRHFTAPEASFPALMEHISNRNDSTTLDPVTSTWETKYAKCGNECSFTVSVKVRITPEKVLYIPPFIEVAKFSWIQFLSTFVFLYIFVRLLTKFVMENQIVQASAISIPPPLLPPPPPSFPTSLGTISESWVLPPRKAGVLGKDCVFV